MYVADRYNYRVQKFTPDGTFITKWGTSGSAAGQFIDLTGVAVDGNIVCVTDFGNHRIQRFLCDGTFLSMWGSNGSGDGQFYLPVGIAVNGNVYVAELVITGSRSSLPMVFF